ncbi:MAG: threonylcarbamoyl-AMP synthase [Deltaproteobacteria bacterium]|nr:threonylcarbamoyl-AMP synthase [Deltaproteobacteria bacterium]
MPIVLPDGPGLAAATDALRAGRLVVVPTETVYGLAADARDGCAVARIYEAKGRPRFNPLIAHVADLAAARQLVVFDGAAYQLAEAFWPGPLTLVLPRLADCPVSQLAGAGLPTLAVRVPDHPVALELLRAFGAPLVAPSANVSGRLSPTRAEHVAGHLADLVLDGGPCRVGVESTIVQVVAGRIRVLRPGGVPVEALRGWPIDEVAAGPAAMPNAPGQLASHYAPDLPLRMGVRRPRHDEALVAFGDRQPAGAARTINLSPTGDLAEAAANLFDVLHRLDDPRLAGIAVVPIPRHGLGAAINDRLRRAAHRP